MTFSKLSTKNWRGGGTPRLEDKQWNSISLLGLVLLVMALTQLVSFSAFKDILAVIGLGKPAAWAVGLIIAEVWAASTFFKVRLSSAFRLVGSGLALLVAGFWFVETVRQAAMSPDMASPVSNVGYFGRFLAQQPGWWTIIEVTILLFYTLYAVDLTKNSD